MRLKSFVEGDGGSQRKQSTHHMLFRLEAKWCAATCGVANRSMVPPPVHALGRKDRQRLLYKCATLRPLSPWMAELQAACRAPVVIHDNRTPTWRSLLLLSHVDATFG